MYSMTEKYENTKNSSQIIILFIGNSKSASTSPEINNPIYMV